MRNGFMAMAIVTAALSASACARASGESSDQAQPAAGFTANRAIATHPLDPLTEDEIRFAVQAAKADSRLAAAAFTSIVLQEPAKAEVLSWQPGRVQSRHARVQAMGADRVFEATVDLAARKVLSVTERRGVEPSITLSELEAVQIVLANAEFKAGLDKRGVDVRKIFCAPFSAGYYGNAADEGKRLVKVGCFDTRRSTTNMFGWPIERLYALVDLRDRARC